MTTDKDSLKIWNSAPEPSSDDRVIPLAEGGTQTVGKPYKKVRWSLLDAFLILAVTIASQVIIGLIAVAVYVSQNYSKLIDLSPEEMSNAMLDDLFTGPFLVFSSLSMYVVWVGGLFIASKKRGFGSFAKDFWLKYKLPRDILIGLGFAAAFRGVEILITTVLTNVGVSLEGADNAAYLNNLDGIWYFILAIGVASLLAPFLEELLFRGLVLQAFLKFFRKCRVTPKTARTDLSKLDAITPVPMGTAEVKIDSALDKVSNAIFKARNILAVLFSSVAFGLMHFQGSFETFGLTFVVLWTGIVGAGLAVLTLKTKRLGPAIFAHIFFNLSGVLMMFFLN